MARKRDMTPDELEAYLGKLQAAKVHEFQGLGISVKFELQGELGQLQADLTDEDVEELRAKIETRKAKQAYEAEVWSSDD